MSTPSVGELIQEAMFNAVPYRQCPKVAGPGTTPWDIEKFGIRKKEIPSAVKKARKKGLLVYFIEHPIAGRDEKNEDGSKKKRAKSLWHEPVSGDEHVYRNDKQRLKRLAKRNELRSAMQDALVAMMIQLGL